MITRDGAAGRARQRVLNARRHRGGDHVRASAIAFFARSCSTPGGIEAVITGVPHAAYAAAEKCSTPGGIEAVITCLADLGDRGNEVLNARRHRGGDHAPHNFPNNSR